MGKKKSDKGRGPGWLGGGRIPGGGKPGGFGRPPSGGRGGHGNSGFFNRFGGEKPRPNRFAQFGSTTARGLRPLTASQKKGALKSATLENVRKHVDAETAEQINHWQELGWVRGCAFHMNLGEKRPFFLIDVLHPQSSQPISYSVRASGNGRPKTVLFSRHDTHNSKVSQPLLLTKQTLLSGLHTQSPHAWITVELPASEFLNGVRMAMRLVKTDIKAMYTPGLLDE